MGGAIKLTAEQAKTMGLHTGLDEVRGELKTRGPWQITVSYKALCTNTHYVPKEKAKFTAESDAFHVYGTRTMSNVKQSGYSLEGRVSICGKKVRAFTSSQLFQLPDGKLVSVAIIHACLLQP